MRTLGLLLLVCAACVKKPAPKTPTPPDPTTDEQNKTPPDKTRPDKTPSDKDPTRTQQYGNPCDGGEKPR